MYKNKIYKYSLASLLVLIVYVFIASTVTAQVASTTSPLPDNVQVSSTPNSYLVTITNKPGFNTQVVTTCTNGVCNNSATLTPLTSADIQKIQNNMKAQELALQQLFQQQEMFFQAQQQYFQSLWNTTNI